MSTVRKILDFKKIFRLILYFTVFGLNFYIPVFMVAL